MVIAESKDYLLILKPRNALRSENKPVIPGASFHDTKIVYAHVTLANDLIAESVATSLHRILRRLLGTATERMLYCEIAAR